jgi:hypothetical protein
MSDITYTIHIGKENEKESLLITAFDKNKHCSLIIEDYLSGHDVDILKYLMKFMSHRLKE